MSDNRQFFKNEISSILAKASAIQAQKDLYGSQDGLTTNELIELAKEVGIDPDSLLEAIQRQDEPEFKNSFKFWRGTSKLIESHTFAGEISTQNWDDIVREIRLATGGIGKVSANGDTFEWEQRRRDFGYKHISLHKESGKTKVQMVSSWSQIKKLSTFLSMIGFTIFSIIGADFVGLKDYTGVILPFSLALGFGASRFILKSVFNEQKKQLTQLFTSIGKRLYQTKSKEPLISLDLGFEEEKSEQRNSTKTRE